MARATAPASACVLMMPPCAARRDRALAAMLAKVLSVGWAKSPRRIRYARGAMRFCPRRYGCRTRGQNAILLICLPQGFGASCPPYGLGSGGARGGTGEDCTIEVVVLPKA